MKVLLSWLRRFAPFEGDPAALGDQMSDLGMAVESMAAVGEGLDGVVVAQVLSLRPHPGADRVQLVEVDAGDGEARQIVCGAFNMAVGDRVPLATLGTTMPGGTRIERRKVRGEWSDGMLCSGAELGLGDDHAGILVLDGAPDLGSDLRQALGIERDVLWDLEVNPNRPDALSVAGVARDLAARLGLPFAVPEPEVVEGPSAAAGAASVEVVDADLCGRFLARVLRGVRVGPSPAWLAGRLRALGMRPVSNVVDASNYVMLELGQPTHAFDLALVPGGALRVRWARPGEQLRTLDGVERTLGPGDGVVADGADTAISIAGVMGGASTEISAATADVLLEAAWWQPMAIARSAKRLGLRSEASARFERGTDPEVLERAALRVAELLAPAGATPDAGAVVAEGDLPAPAVVRVRTGRLNRLLGTDLSGAEVRALLEPIGFRCEPVAAAGEAEGRSAAGEAEGRSAAGEAEGRSAAGEAEGEVQLVTVPSFRPDTATETDVAEEVARHHGYGRIPASLPARPSVGSLTPRQADRRLVRQVLVGLGLDEAMPMPFVAPADLERARCRPGRAVALANPLAAEESVLRTSLRPGLLAAVAYNRSHRNPPVGLFEVGKVFTAPEPPATLPDEPEVLAVALDGEAAPAAVEVWRVLAGALALPGVELRQVAVDGLHPTRSAELVAAGTVVGAVGEVDPGVVGAHDIAGPVAWLEVDLDALLALPHGERPYRKVSRYPSSDVDLAFEVDEATPAAEVEAAVRAAAGPLAVRVDLFDVFRGAPVAEGRRSLAYRLRLQAADRTLTDAEVAEVRQAVVDAVTTALPATLRA